MQIRRLSTVLSTGKRTLASTLDNLKRAMLARFIMKDNSHDCFSTHRTLLFNYEQRCGVKGAPAVTEVIQV